MELALFVIALIGWVIAGLVYLEVRALKGRPQQVVLPLPDVDVDGASAKEALVAVTPVLEAADANWDLLDPEQKEEAQRQTVRAVARLGRLNID